MQKTAFKRVKDFLMDYCKSLNNFDLLRYKNGYAKFLRDYELEDDGTAAALLYDIDDGKKFSDEVSELISALKKFDELASKAGKRNNEEKIRKMLIATTQDLRVLIIKLLEKLYAMKNLDNLDNLDDTEWNKISKDALDIYAPISYRLGLSDIKWELDDLSFNNSGKTF